MSGQVIPAPIHIARGDRNLLSLSERIAANPDAVKVVTGAWLYAKHLHAALECAPESSEQFAEVEAMDAEWSEVAHALVALVDANANLTDILRSALAEARRIDHDPFNLPPNTTHSPILDILEEASALLEGK